MAIAGLVSPSVMFGLLRETSPPFSGKSIVNFAITCRLSIILHDTILNLSSNNSQMTSINSLIICYM